MNKLFFISLIVLVLVSRPGRGQSAETILKEAEITNVFAKKLRWGVSGNQYWGTIKGSKLAKEYFGKPCLGFNFRAEYYLLPFIGVGVGAGVQQRGAGIINPDLSGGSFTHPWELPQFNGDSTYRERLRFNTFEVPLTILLRTPMDVLKGVRLSGAFGLAYVRVSRVNDVFLSVEDGYHQDVIVSGDYASRDVAAQFSFGADMDAGGAGLLQVHLVYTKGSTNVYSANQGDGRLVTYGFRVAWLY